MNMRDEIAAKCCAAMVSTICTDKDYQRLFSLSRDMGFSCISEWVAFESYKQADAMLVARLSIVENK